MTIFAVPAAAVGSLRQRLVDDMTLRRFSRETQRNYIRDVGRLATFLRRSPDTATVDDLRRFQIAQQEVGLGVPTMNAIVSALWFFFVHTIKRPDLARRLVRLAGGAVERYDADLIAEGVGSTTRELVFPGENDPRWMDLAIAYFTIARTPDDDRMWRWFNAPGGRGISLRPDLHGTTRAMLTLRQPPCGEQDWDVQRQKAFLRDRLHDVGWQAARVLSGMETTTDFYFDVLRQVRMKRWSNGRVAVTGDAAWCATPLAGIGTTLAVTGAYVLASELARNEDISTAFATYERAMRPMVEDGQGVPRIAPKIMNPRSRLGIRFLHGALRFTSKPSIRRLASTLSSGRSKEPDLAQYLAPFIA